METLNMIYLVIGLALGYILHYTLEKYRLSKSKEVKVGQKWIWSSYEHDPFKEDKDLRVILNIKGGWVKYRVGVNSSLTSTMTIDALKSFYTLIEDV